MSRADRARVAYENGRYDGRTLREWLPEVLDPIIRDFDPLKVVLFGSVARGEERPGSDIDLLIVVDNPLSKRELALEMKRSIEAPVPVEIVVTDPAELARRGHLVGTVFEPALREGTVLHDRGGWSMAGEPEDPAVVASEWLAYAQEDLRSAEGLVDLVGIPRTGCFHAQQAAEKALKALLIVDQIAPERTHDLAALLTQLPPARRPEVSTDDLDALSRWAVAPRYPGDAEDVSVGHARQMIEIARAVVQAVAEALASG